MAYIKQIEPSEATGELKAFYDSLTEMAGGVPNIVKLASLKLPTMKASSQLYQSVLYQESGLSMEQKEMVATVVSLNTGCVYCWKYHAATLSEITGNDALVDQLLRDWRKADLTTETRAMLEFAEKLTNLSNEMTEADIATLRKLGLKDEDILDLVELSAYFNYVGRRAIALGVDPER